MEHIIQFGVSIDDNAIITKTMDRAVTELKNDLKDKIIENKWGGKGEFTLTAERVFREAIEDMKPEIVESAATKIAESLGRSTKFREKLIDKVGDEVNDGRETM